MCDNLRNHSDFLNNKESLKNLRKSCFYISSVEQQVRIFSLQWEGGKKRNCDHWFLQIYHTLLLNLICMGFLYYLNFS